HIGNFVLFSKDLSNPEQIVNLTTSLRNLSEEANNNIPPFIAIDHEGGRVHRFSNSITHFPSAKQISRELDLFEIKDCSRFMAHELLSLGINMNFAPVLDVYTNKKNKVIESRSYSSDPDVVLSYGRKFIEGHLEKKLIAVPKHFPGHGSTSTDSHKDLPRIKRNLDQLKKTDLMPFRELIKEDKIDCLMIGHLLVETIDSLPASLSKEFVTNILRKKWGYKGLIITDDILMNALMKYYSFEDAIVKAFNAGVDILLICEGDDYWERSYNALYNAIKTEKISHERLDESITRIRQIKEKYSLAERKRPDIRLIYNQLEKPDAILLKEKAEGKK
ncbi:MAG: beta-N-acetylhexosaminidase, partial [Candidatus Coatesbacteria bacterium]|nr:beta-N-acetylhexosaminidase [Candidatus Coatesbacteria bacterium]